MIADESLKVTGAEAVRPARRVQPGAALDSLSDRPRVVIVGGGFGGLSAARALRRAPARVTLVDAHNYHLFQPLLYQVATASLSPADIAYPIRAILRKHRNTEVLLARVTSVDAVHRRILLEDGGTIPYEILVLAPGASHSYFGHDDWEAAAPGLKTLEDALEIRRRILLAFEEAERNPDEESRRALLTFVVIGGGPTGVELAGSLVEIARHTLRGEFRSMDPQSARIILVEAAPRILTAYPESLSRSARAQLQRLGVEVRASCTLEAIEEGRIRLVVASSGAVPTTEWLATRNVLWAAGVAASPIARSLDVPLDRAGRVPVLPDLTVPGHPEIYVIGDLASFVHQGDKPLPGVAPVAMQQGRAVATNILRSLRGEPTRPFHYRDKGNLATIGRAAAVADFGWARLSGLPAWLAWGLIHIFYLIGFRSRTIVMFEWAWAYLTHKHGARLITGGNDRSRSC